jgi:hypothetical protein
MSSCADGQIPHSEDQSDTRSEQSNDKFDFGCFSFSQLSVKESPIDVDRLLDICGDDLMLVSDVLDTFCVQGRDRAESLESASRNHDIRQAVFDSVSQSYLMGLKMIFDL